MRRSLIVAIVGVVVGALFLAGAGTFLLANAGARRDSARELAVDAHRVAAEAPTLLALRAAKLRNGIVRAVKATVGADFLAVLPGPSGDVGPGAAVVLGTLPATLTLSQLHPRALLGGTIVSGTAGTIVYAAVVLPGVAPSTVARALGAGRTAGAPAGAGAATNAGAVVVMVLTRRFIGAGLGGLYLLLVSAATVVVATVVATVISRRITRPLVAAVAATEQIAQGDLEVRTPEHSGHYPELAQLSRAINAMAAGLARAKGLERQFLLSVSHDLRTPLTSILGYAEAIADGAVPDPKAAATIVATEARRLDRLVQDLLDLARLDARQFSLHLAPVPLTPLVAAAADAVRPALGAAGLELQVTLPDDNPLWATVDPDRARQVVANLLDNAYKFAAATVHVAADSAPAGWVVVSVSDDGPGIAPDDLPNVFERFFQSSRTEARHAGSGLGLAIVAELVAAMGGHVQAASPATSPKWSPLVPATEASATGPAGHGSRFAVWLPATAPATSVPTSASPPVPPAEPV